jgi:hypothetical protein
LSLSKPGSLMHTRLRQAQTNPIIKSNFCRIINESNPIFDA